MALRHITRQSVQQAIQEFDRVGRKKFLKNNGFGTAQTYWLIYDGRRYDSKAIIGVAHKYARPDLGRLKNFSGGKDTVQPKLESLNFIVRVGNADTGDIILPGEADAEPFDPSNIKDARKRNSKMIAQRRGQPAFRNALLDAYDRKCAITGCEVVEVLEAAHIYPYQGPDTSKVVNGLLLRADVHTLFDSGLIAIDAMNMTVLVHPSLQGSEYWTLHRKKLRLPPNTERRPNCEALKMHCNQSYHGSSQ